MFITTFEILKNSVVDRIRRFYLIGLNEGDPIVDLKYHQDVISRNKSVLCASLTWLREREAIDEKDLETFEHLKKIRNQLAHQLFESVTGQTESVHEVQFPVLIELPRKIEVWWVVNLEIPNNPDYDVQEIDEAGIVLGSILTLQMLIQVASGNTELLAHWRKTKAKESADA